MFGCILIIVLVFFAPSKGADVGNILSCTIVPIDHANSTCVNTDVTSFSFSTKITGIDLGEYHAARITNLFLASKYMYYVPNNIFKFFPNVTEIGIHTALPQLIKIEKQHFVGLTKLEKLFIVGQRLRHIGPNVFAGAPAITDLFLPSNQIQSINELAFRGLDNCQHLMLNGNQIEKLKAGTFAPMPNLWSLNLSKNRLIILTEFTLVGNTLVLLDLSHNKIESIPENIVTNFISSKDPKKLLSMKGNICDNRIYTKNTHRVEKNLVNCIKGSSFLPDRELIERMREEIKFLEQNYARLELENYNLVEENKRLNDELKELESASACNEEKCRTLYWHIWKIPLNVIQNLIPILNSWKTRSQSLFTTLATIHGDGACVDPEMPGTDCSSKEQLNLITSVEDQVYGLRKTAQNLSSQSFAFGQFVREILWTVEQTCTTTVAPPCATCPECPEPEVVTCPPIEECPTPEPPPVCEVCPETTTMGPIYCPTIMCPAIQCPPIQCPACIGVGAIIDTRTTEKPCTEYLQTLEALEAEMIILRAINSTYHQKTYKATCGVEIEIEELDRIVLTQSIEIENLKKVVDDLTQGTILLRKEAETEEIKTQGRLENIFDLKEEKADCASLRQLDLIEITSKVSKTLLSEKDRVLERVMSELQELIGVKNVHDEVIEGDGVENAVVKSPQGEKNPEIVEVVGKNPEVSEAVVIIVDAVKTKYKLLKYGDVKIQELVGEIAKLIMVLNRRGVVSDKMDQVNSVIIGYVRTLEQLIQEQYDVLRNTTEKIANLINSSIAKLAAIFGKRAISGRSSSMILQPLNGLNKTIIEKDSLLSNKYEKIEKYIAEIKDSRVGLQQGNLLCCI